MFDMKFMFQCLGDIYLRNEWIDSGDSNSTKMVRKENVGPGGYPIATSST